MTSVAYQDTEARLSTGVSKQLCLTRHVVSKKKNGRKEVERKGTKSVEGLNEENEGFA